MRIFVGRRIGKYWGGVSVGSYGRRRRRPSRGGQSSASGWVFIFFVLVFAIVFWQVALALIGAVVLGLLLVSIWQYSHRPQNGKGQ